MLSAKGYLNGSIRVVLQQIHQFIYSHTDGIRTFTPLTKKKKRYIPTRFSFENVSNRFACEWNEIVSTSPC